MSSLFVPPIMLGDSGDRKTLQLVAKYAGASSPESRVPAEVAAKLEVLWAHYEREGTDCDRITKGVLWAGPLDPMSEPGGRYFTGQLRVYAAVGVTEVHVMPWGGNPVAHVDGLGRHVVPRVADLG